ncbi:hypothetical protein NSK_004567 [Nannochloropsis salina CCMP1776]|uniref:Uncharacterized protein n=1 Tax=Nannochloropsis salina CCMP1776 TaxID=1027361 RepID=A0A4D9CZS2_9STRA|nr:hypothetical protein NSK_004567 [Nannochloropsis salina CCMP1776]|eukprot:TFJ84094.1 hypothetical protein NSK_004567 [Nannochloropsis salina CCMP1776]
MPNAPKPTRSVLQVGEGSTHVKELAALNPEDYVAIGLAMCYKINDGGKLDEVLVMEPLTAGTLECLALGVPTSYKRVMGLTCGELFNGEDLRNPSDVNIEALRPLAKGETVSECEDMLIRSMAAARTFKRRVEAQIIPLGEVADDFNFNTEKKRVLNQVFEPSFADNVKQDKSIDVYGRADEEFNDEVDKLANA